MFSEMEKDLVDLVKQSPLNAKLKQVGTLPDADADTLVNRLASDAPAVYVAAGQDLTVNQDVVNIPFAYVLVAKNARGHEAVRHGDSTVIGLYQMLEAMFGLLNGGSAGGYAWEVTSAGFVDDDKLIKNGLMVMVMTVSTSSTMPLGLDESTLDVFETFHADYDIDPPL